MKLSLKVYRGYANDDKIVVFGHVFKKHSPDDFRLDARWYKHAWSVIRMFMIKTVPDLEVKITFRELSWTTTTDTNGFFQAEIPYDFQLEEGWYSLSVHLPHFPDKKAQHADFFKPSPHKQVIVSDIDDTFLVSHSDNIFKKLYILLTKNIHKRHIFEEVVDHYRYLNARNEDSPVDSNAFFYVSSSEWNLYNFIYRFTKLHEFPKAVLLLNTLKSGIGDFLMTGGGNHQHKLEKLKRLMVFYPNMDFVLLGDDSQRDPLIYKQLCKTFPDQVEAVYIRQTGKQTKAMVTEIMTHLKDNQVNACYFKDSSTAIKHSNTFLSKKNPGS